MMLQRRALEEEKRFSPHFLLLLLKIQQTKARILMRCSFAGCTAASRIKRLETTTVSKLLSHLGQLNNFTFEMDFFFFFRSTLGK